jgi:hypothetical protein
MPGHAARLRGIRYARPFSLAGPACLTGHAFWAGTGPRQGITFGHRRLREGSATLPGRGTQRLGQGKRARTAPSDRRPSRRQRTRSPLSTGRPGPFPSPTPPSSRIRAAAPLTAPGVEAAGCVRPYPWHGPDHGGLATSGQPARCWTVQQHTVHPGDVNPSCHRVQSHPTDGPHPCACPSISSPDRGPVTERTRFSHG